jgi:hypothetical protein
MEKLRNLVFCRVLALFVFLAALTGVHRAQAQLVVTDIIQDINTVIQTGHQVVMDIHAVANTIQHSEFYSYLKTVSNGVKTYNRVKSIISNQTWMVQSAIDNLKYLQSSKHLRPSQVIGMVRMYKYFMDQSAENAAELTKILSPSFFQMSDSERIQYIDNLETRTVGLGKTMLYYNTRSIAVEAQQRRATEDLETLKKHYAPTGVSLETPATAHQKMGGFYGSVVDLLYALSAVVALIGSVKVYRQFTMGDTGVFLTASSWFGSVLAAVLLTTFIKLLFF